MIVGTWMLSFRPRKRAANFACRAIFTKFIESRRGRLSQGYITGEYYFLAVAEFMARRLRHEGSCFDEQSFITLTECHMGMRGGWHTKLLGRRDGAR